MRPLGTTVTVLTLLCASAVAVASAPLIKKTYSYFNISGLTGADLERELSKHGPMLAETGIRHPGATKIKLGGSVDYRNSDGRCRVLDAKVTLETHLTLPRWTDRHRANRETVLVWDTLSSDIKRHEERHAEIARQYARKLEKTLEALYPERNCQRMEAKVDATSKRIIEEHAADQQRFDRVEAASFERRMLRMLRFKAAKQNNRS
jgi:predicted secreted Zn-dependent protease